MITTYAGWELHVRIARSGSALAAASNITGIQRISFSRVEGVEAKTECGTRYPFIVEGIIGLTGTFERFYTGSGLWEYVGGGTPTASGSINYYTIGIYPGGYATGNVKTELDGVKFTTREESQRPGTSIYSEVITFIGTGSVVTGSVA